MIIKKRIDKIKQYCIRILAVLHLLYLQVLSYNCFIVKGTRWFGENAKIKAIESKGMKEDDTFNAVLKIQIMFLMKVTSNLVKCFCLEL